VNIARVLGCPVVTVLRIDIATKMKICFTRHENMVKVIFIQRSTELHKQFFYLQSDILNAMAFLLADFQGILTKV